MYTEENIKRLYYEFCSTNSYQRQFSGQHVVRYDSVCWFNFRSMKNPIRNTIITFLVAIGMLLYLYVFIDAMKEVPNITDDAVLQFAMTIGVSISAFIGAWLGVDTKRRLDNKRLESQGRSPMVRTLNPWQYKLQFVIIVLYLITLVIGAFMYIQKNDSDFIHSLFTNATGLMLGALAVVLSPVEE